MSTYDHKQVLSDYATGKITPEMAIGHGLQHIGKLYEAQNDAKAGRLDQQSQISTLEKRVNTLQVAVDRLTATIEKFRVKRKPSDPKLPKSDQP
ncbi:MAG: hypothetical protein HC780_23635 [Leptolyngbyaceae cyanobacterium CSU_1_3]|nr:hypothetical protein [Leptolyngbyaceae cyanobacterium CSU_1_3]